MKKKLFLYNQPAATKTGSSAAQAVSRRAFMQHLLLAGKMVAAGHFGIACSTELAELPQSGEEEAHQLPDLGGAPDNHQGVTVAAFVDTIVPGRYRDPEGAPGGIDVGAPGLFFDPELPAAPFVGVLVLVLDATAKRLFAGRSFSLLRPGERDEVVAQCLDDTALFGFAVQLAKLAYFASPQAAEHLGYPGSNPGYVNDADFGFDAALASELTLDGNWP